MPGATTGITLAQLAASGRLVVVQCAHCQNRTLSRTSELDLPMELPVNQVGALLKCGGCASYLPIVFSDCSMSGRSPSPSMTRVMRSVRGRFSQLKLSTDSTSTQTTHYKQPLLLGWNPSGTQARKCNGREVPK